MRASLKTVGLSMLVSLLLVLPLAIMEVVNRRSYGEDFPFMLFYALWLNTFAICIILLPVVLSWRSRHQVLAEPVSAQPDTLLTNPWTAALISVILFLSPFILIWLDSLGWISIQTLVNGPNPDVFYLPGVLINLGVFFLPVAGGIIARTPIVRTLRAGGSLFAHPINLLIVFLFLSAILYGLAGLIIDQWPCFMGVPLCD